MNDRPGSETPPPAMDELLAAYALDAVDPAEREMIERHIAADPAARAEVDEMRETAAMLASLPDAGEGAPEGLWDRIAGAIGVTSDPRTESALPTVVPLARQKRAVPARYAIPIAAAAALIIVVLAVQVVTRSPNRAGDIAAAYNHAVANGATTVQLQRAGGTGSVAAEIAVQRDGSGYLRNVHLAALPTGQTYQLWAIVDRGKAKRAISAGVLGPDPSAVAFHVAAAPAAFAITIESAPGVVRSKNDPVAVGSLVTGTAT